MFLAPLPYNTIFDIAGKIKKGRIGPIVSSPFSKIAHAFVGRATLARPDLAARIAVAALTASRPVHAYSRNLKPVAGEEISCEWADCIIEAAIAGNPAAAGEIRDATLSAAPMLRDCILTATNQPCSTHNEFAPPSTNSPTNPAEVVPPPVSPEQPPTTTNRG